MTREKYRELRQSVGSQAAVAGLLKVDVSTISKRERGITPITFEAVLALQCVQLMPWRALKNDES